MHCQTHPLRYEVSRASIPTIWFFVFISRTERHDADNAREKREHKNQFGDTQYTKSIEGRLSSTTSHLEDVNPCNNATAHKEIISLSLSHLSDQIRIHIVCSLLSDHKRQLNLALWDFKEPTRTCFIREAEPLRSKAKGWFYNPRRPRYTLCFG